MLSEVALLINNIPFFLPGEILENKKRKRTEKQGFFKNKI